jgi:hypothetical protein
VSLGARAWPGPLVVAVTVSLPVALLSTGFHLVPTLRGGFRGITDPPSLARWLVAAAVALAALSLLVRCPRQARAPLLALALAACPILPVLTGRLPLLLAFQGPVLVLVGLMAGAVALGRLAGSRTPWDPSSAVLFAAAFALYAVLGMFVPGPAGPQGDEPHYLTMAQSLLSDGDLDLTDEFAEREYAPFFGGTLEAHTSPQSPRGRLYAVHTPGLPALILPAYAVGGYPAVRWLMSALAALTAVLVARLVGDATGSPGARLATFGIVAFTPPLAFYALAVYPETPAALATACFLLAARSDPKPGRLLLVSGIAAALPWLHPKFLPLAILGLGLVLVRRASPMARACALAVFAGSLALLLAFFKSHYGRASFGAAYGPGLSTDVSLLRAPLGMLALLLDRQFGLLFASPVWCLALPGLGLLLRERLGDALRVVLLGGATAVVGAAFSMWWGGSCPPARFLVPALPALALALAPALARFKDTAAALTGLGLGALVLAAEAPRILQNRADGESALLRFLCPALDLSGGLPSFVLPSPGAPLLALALLAALALGFLWGARGLASGLAACTILSLALAEGPLLDPRQAPLHLLAAYDGDNVVGLSGPLDIATLSIPFDLPAAPWTLEPGEERLSRRLDLPPGTYTFRAQGRVLRALRTAHVIRIDLTAGEDLLLRTYLQEGQPPPAAPLALPSGARRLLLTATGIQGTGLLESAGLQPVEVVPRRRRETASERGYGTWMTSRASLGLTSVTASIRASPPFFPTVTVTSGPPDSGKWYGCRIRKRPFTAYVDQRGAALQNVRSPT